MGQSGNDVPTREIGYLPRLVEERLSRLFAQLPAIMLTGPRAAGKTTLGRRHARTVVRLDRPAEAGAFRADPDAALRGLPEPVLLDEWQSVPSVLGAVKRAVDDAPGPGRFLLTGSVRADLQSETWPGTGRVVRVRLYGLTIREVLGHSAAPPFVDRLARATLAQFPLPPDPPDLRGYIELALQSGFPEPLLMLDEEARQAWLDGYLEQLLTRDIIELTNPRDPARLRRYFEALALNTAGLPEHQTLYGAAGIDRKTAVEYDRLLTNLFVIDTLPAWTSNRLSRLVKTSKRYLVDAGLFGSALRLDSQAILRDADLLGRTLDTFVLAQLRPEIEVSRLRPRLYHVREKEGRHEVDIVGELGTGVVGIEVKATAAPSPGDAVHLAYLRDALGDRFLGGAVLHTGPRAFVLGERICALPICALWGEASAA